MDALFIVPAMISSNVNERIVPPLVKMIERNIILNNYASFRVAALKRYTGWFKTATLRASTEEDNIDELLQEQKSKSSEEKDSKEKDKEKETFWTKAGKLKGVARGVSLKDKPAIQKEKEIEIPKGIVFFNAVSLEPTYLVIPIEQNASLFSDKEKTETNIHIGVKCVPYLVKNVKDIVTMMEQLRSKDIIRAQFFRMWNSVKGKIPLTKGWWIRHGYRGGAVPRILPKPGEPTEKQYEKLLDIVFSPSSKQLSNPRFLKKLMSSKSTSYWSTLSVLSVDDFKGTELQDNVNNYKRLVAAGWGDIIIDNFNDGSVYFCTQKLGACYQMSYRMMKQALMASDIFDYSEIKSYRSPFNRIAGVPRALSDGYIYDPKLEVEEDILNIIQGD